MTMNAFKKVNAIVKFIYRQSKYLTPRSEGLLKIL